jgi:L-lactate dehydrogenase complex protein LldE
MRVALFATCLVDGLFPEVGKATVRLLERLGHRVEVPLGQTCCGQMHVNTGYPGQAMPLVRNHVAAFRGYPAVVAPSGSCVAAVRHQHRQGCQLPPRLDTSAADRNMKAAGGPASQVDAAVALHCGSYVRHAGWP